MTDVDLDLQQLDDWIASDLASLPVLQSATRSPEALALPGVLVQVTGLGLDTLAQDVWRVDLRLVLVVPNLDVATATADLVDVLNAVRRALGLGRGLQATPSTFTNDQGQVFPAMTINHTVHID